MLIAVSADPIPRAPGGTPRTYSRGKRRWGAVATSRSLSGPGTPSPPLIGYRDRIAETEGAVARILQSLPTAPFPPIPAPSGRIAGSTSPTVSGPGRHNSPNGKGA